MTLLLFDVDVATTALVGLFLAGQIFYSVVFLVDLYLFSLPVNWTDPDEPITIDESRYPYLILFYPVLRELEATMFTTFTSLARLDYPADRFRVVAIPNSNDRPTVESLRRLQQIFPFVDLLEVPPTTDPSWQLVWDAWDINPNCYWWHRGPRAYVQDSAAEEDPAAHLRLLSHGPRARPRAGPGHQLHRCRQLPPGQSPEGRRERAAALRCPAVTERGRKSQRHAGVVVSCLRSHGVGRIQVPASLRQRTSAVLGAGQGPVVQGGRLDRARRNSIRGRPSRTRKSVCNSGRTASAWGSLPIR